MLPGGKSTSRKNQNGGCCGTTTYATSSYSWIEKAKELVFSIKYELRSIEESGEKPIQTISKFNGKCIVTGIQKKGSYYEIITSSKDSFCKGLKLFTATKLLGSDSDDYEHLDPLGL